VRLISWALSLDHRTVIKFVLEDGVVDGVVDGNPELT